MINFIVYDRNLFIDGRPSASAQTQLGLEPAASQLLGRRPTYSNILIGEPHKKISEHRT